jgi:hypothetical protein
LGEETGLRDCPSCLGNVRLKVFACSHPAHGETTLQDCGACADHEEREPQMASGGREPAVFGALTADDR